jgi:hypothetical protein
MKVADWVDEKYGMEHELYTILDGSRAGAEVYRPSRDYARTATDTSARTAKRSGIPLRHGSATF